MRRLVSGSSRHKRIQNRQDRLLSRLTTARWGGIAERGALRIKARGQGDAGGGCCLAEKGVRRHGAEQGGNTSRKGTLSKDRGGPARKLVGVDRRIFLGEHTNRKKKSAIQRGERSLRGQRKQGRETAAGILASRADREGRSRSGNGFARER